LSLTTIVAVPRFETAPCESVARKVKLSGPLYPVTGV
jgi:hypothetical protein